MAGSASKTVLLMLFLVYVEGTSAQANSTVGGSLNITMAATTVVTQPMSSDMRSTASPSAADMTTGMRTATIPSTVQSDTTTDMRSTTIPSTASVDTTTDITASSVAMTTDAMATTTSVVIKANTTASVVLDPEELANQKIGNIMALSLAIPLNTFTAITLAVFIVGKRRKRLSVPKGDDQLKLEAADSKGVDNGGYAVHEEKNGKAYMTSSVGNGDHLGMESTKL